MLRVVASLIAVGIFVAGASPTMAARESGAASVHKTETHRTAARTSLKGKAQKQRSAKRRGSRRGGPYGFLPGYRPPQVIEQQRRSRERYGYYGGSGPFYSVLYPRFYRGRWNGGGFGPCYTYTPIGPMWNCGR